MSAVQYQGRISAIEQQLAVLGFQMEASLSGLAGDEGHALVEVASGDLVDPPTHEVLMLASEWSLLVGIEVEEDVAAGVWEAIDAWGSKGQLQ